MNAPFDPQPTRDQAKPRPRAVRPRDAATLILVRKERDGPKVLMGQRAKGHVFMPDKWVFPGGAVDPSDGLAPAATELLPEADELLRIENPRRKPRAFAMAAVRELIEEAGLVMGRRGAPGGKPPRGWEDYYAHDASPELHKLTFIGRAITPPMSPRRYDARFFMADADDVLLDDRPLAGDDELLQLKWFPFEEAEKLDLPSITRTILKEAHARVDGATPRPVFFRFTNKKAATVRM